MKGFYKLFFIATVVASMFFAMPIMAQIPNTLYFKTSFPFYVENTYMPAGSYMVKEVVSTPSILSINSENGTRSAFIDTITSPASHVHDHTELVFTKYGNNTYFLHRIWVTGNKSDTVIEPTNYETSMANYSVSTSQTVSGVAKQP